MNIEDCNSQLEFLRARGDDLNKSYSELFGISNKCNMDEHLDTYLTPMQWACTKGDINLLIKLVIYHLTSTNSSSSSSKDSSSSSSKDSSSNDSNSKDSSSNDSDLRNGSYEDNLASSLVICIQEKQGDCFRLLLEVGADPLRRVNVFCTLKTTAFQEACGSHTGWYLIHFLKRGYCSDTALIDLVSSSDSSWTIGKVLKPKKSYFSASFTFRNNYQAMLENCTPDKLMDECHWTNIPYVISNVPGCKELVETQLTKCKTLFNQPRVGDLKHRYRGDIINKIDALTDYLTIDQVTI